MSRMQGGPLVLGGFLPYRLSILANKVSRAFSRLYEARFNLTVPEWRVMAVLGQEPGLSADTVCVRTQMDKVSVSRAVARLLRKGQVRREFSGQDRRRSILRLSPPGQTTYARIIPIAREYEKRLLAGLDEEERKVLGGLLEKLDSRAAELVDDRESV